MMSHMFVAEELNAKQLSSRYSPYLSDLEKCIGKLLKKEGKLTLKQPFTE